MTATPEGAGGETESEPRTLGPWEGRPSERPEGLGEITQAQATLLANPNRQLIVDQLGRTPGLNLNTLARETGLHRSLVRFHVHRLEHGDLVAVRQGVKGREQVCFLVEDAHLWEDPRTRVLFGGEPTRNVALFVAENPGATVQRIADAVDRKPRTIRHHLDELHERDLVDRVQDGTAARILPRDDLRRWKTEVGDGFEPAWED